ncbi:MAG: Mitochondrial distribution and morphology protein 31, mitochondrial precursor [Icmadophila ericetorum]|nr:Mitochondrial distribution and morphology protein 31, mitochondrial precursor [Icmadophila ericetorum]
MSSDVALKLSAHLGALLSQRAATETSYASFLAIFQKTPNVKPVGLCLQRLHSPPQHPLLRFATRNSTLRDFPTRSFTTVGFSPRIAIPGSFVPKYVLSTKRTFLDTAQLLDRRKSLSAHRFTPRRFKHTDSQGGNIVEGKKNKNSDADAEDKVVYEQGAAQEKVSPQESPNKHVPSAYTGQHLIDRLPNISNFHRPTREELLAAATGFWSRLKVRFKWFSIRSARPFNADEIGAFFSWILLGHVLWIILGTTTFFSLAIFAVNTVFAQETLARWIGNYLTKSSGIKVVFESAIVPKWGDGVITFKNVFVSRRPGQGSGKVSKGSPETAAAAAAATAAADLSRGGNSNFQSASDEEDANYTQFDVSLETVNVTLSFTKWFNSKGLLQNVEIKGVRGVIDRRSVHYSGEHIDPRTYRHQHNPGDFELDSFKMEDLLLTVYQPKDFRPFTVSIFTCDLPQLRRQWLFYDFLSANVISGSFDESLFTIHPRQIHGSLASQLPNGMEARDSIPWKKQSRLRIDGLNIHHLNRGVEGPFSWIHEGNVDIVADIMFPADNDESIARIVSDFYDRMEATVTSKPMSSTDTISIINNNESEGVDEKLPIAPALNHADDKRFLVMDLRVHLNDVRAAVPIFTKDLSYVNNALIRPIVAFINSRNTFIPINCRLIKRASEFDGSWTIFDSGLMDDLSAETYRAFVKSIEDDQARLRRFRKVGLWSLQLALQALFMGMAGNIA